MENACTGVMEIFLPDFFKYLNQTNEKFIQNIIHP